MKLCLKCEHVFSSNGWICPSCRYKPIRLGGFEEHAPEFAHEGGGFKSEYFTELVKLESAHFWFQARNQLILWALRRHQPDAHKFLEVGCGTGFVLSGIAKAHPKMVVAGSEIFLAGLSHAAKRVPTAHFMQMDARRVPYAEEFDVIGAFDVLEHIREDETVLAQLHRALKPRGVLLLTVPQHPWLWSASDDYACHVRRYTKRELHNKLAEANFSVERSTSFVSLLLTMMLLSRLKKKHINVEYDPATEFRLPKSLNSFFLNVMRFERVLIRFGINFPLGGSRLIVARKL